MTSADILVAFRFCASQSGGKSPVTVTEVVDLILDENGGSREYVTRKVRDAMRELGRKEKLIPMQKQITAANGTLTHVPAYKEKRS